MYNGNRLNNPPNATYHQVYWCYNVRGNPTSIPSRGEGVEILLVTSCYRNWRYGPQGGGGVLAVYMTGRSDLFFWFEFLGQEICHVFFRSLSLFD